MDIPNINIPNNDIRIGDIRDVNINVMPDWMTNPPQAVPIYPPVTTQVGVPIINIPCLLYTSPSPRDQRGSRMPSSA